MPAFTPPDLARTLKAEAVTVLFAAPAHVAACLGAGLLDDTDTLSPLRLAVLSGSAVAPSVARGLQERMANGHVTQLWGMTETQAGLYTRPGDPIEAVAGSAGRPSPGTEVRVVDPDDAALPPGREGELHIRGSLLFPGYFDNPEANREAFSAEGWFRTGDLAVVDPDGNVAITGRCKDVINRGGVKYNPRDIEDLLAAHPEVEMAAIVPVPGPGARRTRLLLHHRRRRLRPDPGGALRLPGGERHCQAPMAGASRGPRCDAADGDPQGHQGQADRAPAGLTRRTARWWQRPRIAIVSPS